MKPATLLRLAFAGGRADTVRVVLTALSAALATVALLSASTMIAIPTAFDGGSNVSPQYSNALVAEAGLRPGVTFVLFLLTVPVLVLAGQSARLGAPARDRRLAALRMAGAGPRQAIAVASAETGIAAAAGAITGLGAYLAGRQLLDRPDPVTGKLPLPTDVLAPAWAIVAVCVCVPALAALAAAVLLRRVAFTPFGVVREVREQRPGPWPGLLIAAGIGVFLLLTPLGMVLGRGPGPRLPVFGLLILLGGLSALAGVVLGTAWISHVAGRVLHRYARRPATLLAARRLLADPWAGARTLAALLGVVMLAAVTAGFRSSMAAQFVLEDAIGRDATVPADIALDESAVSATHAFYFQAMDLINLALVVAAVVAAGGLIVALGESVVSRRRTFAALVATGVPRRTLVGVVAWQSLAPLLPGIALALGVGLVLVRTLYGEVAATPGYSCPDPATCGEPAPVVMDVPVPVADLAAIGVGAAAIALLVLGVGLLFVRASTALDELRAT